MLIRSQSRSIWNSPDEAVMDSLLSICSQIFTHQPVTDLHMEDVTCNGFIKILLGQLIDCHCGETLQMLRLISMNLAPFESLLDELLEDLVAHHEAGLAQRKLELSLYGNGYPTNLSEEFVEKWLNRCEKVDSIDCVIADS